MPGDIVAVITLVFGSEVFAPFWLPICAVFLLAATLGASFGLAQTPDDPPIRKGPAAVLQSVKMISDAEGPALEIVSSQAPDSTIQFLDSPPRLVIDLPNTKVLLPRKRLEVGTSRYARCESTSFSRRRPSPGWS